MQQKNRSNITDGLIVALAVAVIAGLWDSYTEQKALTLRVDRIEKAQALREGLIYEAVDRLARIETLLETRFQPL